MKPPYALRTLGIGLASVLLASAATAGEIKGPPPSGNYTGDPTNMQSRSLCAFSGLNDSPDGDPSVDDPGGLVQSFGAFFASNGFYVSDLDPRTDFLSPGFGCNPRRGPSLK